MSTASAPMEIGRVALAVLDLDAQADFYARTLGLQVLSRQGGVAVLGAGDAPLLELRGDPALRRASGREPGLFHTAFLLPNRAALGRWLLHAVETRLPAQGASDHLVSEAIYLADPEGNGSEVYADRPRLGWYHPDGRLRMGTEALDLQSLAQAADGRWTGAPVGTVVGHVHLQVGAVPPALEFYRDGLGFQVMDSMPSAAFFGAGGYHHHLAANVWNSRGAPPRSLPATGLAEVELRLDPDRHDALTARFGPQVADPWNTLFRLTRKEN